jgi:hypothetical protein
VCVSCSGLLCGAESELHLACMHMRSDLCIYTHTYIYTYINTGNHRLTHIHLWRDSRRAVYGLPRTSSIVLHTVRSCSAKVSCRMYVCVCMWSIVACVRVRQRFCMHVCKCAFMDAQVQWTLTSLGMQDSSKSVHVCIHTYIHTYTHANRMVPAAKSFGRTYIHACMDRQWFQQLGQPGSGDGSAPSTSSHTCIHTYMHTRTEWFQQLGQPGSADGPTPSTSSHGGGTAGVKRYATTTGGATGHRDVQQRGVSRAPSAAVSGSATPAYPQFGMQRPSAARLPTSPNPISRTSSAHGGGHLPLPSFGGFSHPHTSHAPTRAGTPDQSAQLMANMRGASRANTPPVPPMMPGAYGRMF